LGYGAAVCIAWRTVAGRADVQKLFVVHFYYSGVLILLMSGWFMTLMGILKAGSPQFYASMMDSVNRGNPNFFFEPGNPDALLQARGFLLVFRGGMAAAIAWCIAGWGAYRELNRLSALRSAVAAAVFVALSIPVSAVFLYFASFGSSAGSS
jgi:hypothetical protein